MLTYYSAVTVLCLMSLATLAVTVWENNRMPSRDKRLFYLTYALIATTILVEWLGGWVSDRTDLPADVLVAIKCVDYIVKPMAGGALVAQMRPRNKGLVALMCLLVLNTVLQIVAAFNGWMVVVDADGLYSNGILYPAYLTACFAVVVLVTVESALYGKAFSKQNSLSLASVMLFVIAGIAMQALLPARPKAACVAMTLGASLMYIRTAEFSSLVMDERLATQRELLDTDALTGVRSRLAYTQKLDALNAAGELPPDLVAFAVDINGLKQVNDALGHEAGDELIIGAARCLEKAFGAGAKVYRTGGDEFVVFAHMGAEEPPEALRRVSAEAAAWQGEQVSELGLSCGYARAADCMRAPAEEAPADASAGAEASAEVQEPEALAAEALVREADRMMYAAKAEYYRNAQHDRRRPRATAAVDRRQPRA